MPSAPIGLPPRSRGASSFGPAVTLPRLHMDLKLPWDDHHLWAGLTVTKLPEGQKRAAPEHPPKSLRATALPNLQKHPVLPEAAFAPSFFNIWTRNGNWPVLPHFRCADRTCDPSYQHTRCSQPCNEKKVRKLLSPNDHSHLQSEWS